MTSTRSTPATTSPLVGDYDYVVLAAPLTTETTGLVSAEVLAAMKPTARLINVARGELVDTSALTDALASGSVAGAALDVVHPEPLPQDTRCGAWTTSSSHPT